MSLWHLIWMIVGGVLLVAAAIFCYLSVYQRKINRVLATGERMRRPMAAPGKVLLVLLILLAVVLAVLSFVLAPSGAPVQSAKDIEQYALKRAREDGMEVEMAATDGLMAVLYYNEDRSDHKFEIYENRGTVITDYSFDHGGSSVSIERGMRMFRYENGEMVLFSMNGPAIAKIVCRDGTAYVIDPESPFVLIVPSGGVDFYDEDGVQMDVGQDWWYEVTEKAG